MKEASPRLTRYQVQSERDALEVMGELDAILRGVAHLAQADLRDGFSPGFTNPSEADALGSLLEEFLSEEHPPERLRLTYNHLLAYLVLLDEIWMEWIDENVEAGVLVTSELPTFQATADEYAELQERHAYLLTGFSVLNRVIGPVPCFVPMGQLAGVWVPERADWDSYIKNLRKTQEG